jgi:hypothetical protein
MRDKKKKRRHREVLNPTVKSSMKLEEARTAS